MVRVYPASHPETAGIDSTPLDPKKDTRKRMDGSYANNKSRGPERPQAFTETGVGLLMHFCAVLMILYESSIPRSNIHSFWASTVPPLLR